VIAILQLLHACSCSENARPLVLLLPVAPDIAPFVNSWNLLGLWVFSLMHKQREKPVLSIFGMREVGDFAASAGIVLCLAAIIIREA